MDWTVGGLIHKSPDIVNELSFTLVQLRLQSQGNSTKYSTKYCQVHAAPDGKHFNVFLEHLILKIFMQFYFQKKNDDVLDLTIHLLRTDSAFLFCNFHCWNFFRI